jgi:hypothetical protein
MPTQAEVRQLVIDFSQEKRKDWLLRARAMAHSIALKRGEVCADDIHANCPIPDRDVDRRIMGAVFRGMVFVRFKKSERPACHHRVISVFKLP